MLALHLTERHGQMSNDDPFCKNRPKTRLTTGIATHERDIIAPTLIRFE
jgi:hypothetical protein